MVILVSMPAIVKVLQYLSDHPAGASREEITGATGESSTHVDKALNKLKSLGVIDKRDGVYFYMPGQANDCLSDQLLKVYQTITHERARDLFVRGLICQVPSQHPIHLETLLDIAEKEGMDRHALRRFLQQEIARGYVKRMGIVFGKTNAIGTTILLPVYLTPYHWIGLRSQGDIKTYEYETLDPDAPRREADEEDYILAQYPPELATSAREYMKDRGKELVQYLRDMDTMFWGGWLWRRKKVGQD